MDTGGGSSNTRRVLYFTSGAALAALLLSPWFAPKGAVARKAPAPLATGEGSASSPHHGIGKRPDERAAEAEAQRRNDEAAKERKGFENDGWKFVDAPAPDPKVVGLDPEAYPEKEKELQLQLQSTALTEELVPRAAELAVKAGEGKTRDLALEALTRAAGSAQPEAATRALMGLFDELPDSRGTILGALRAQSVNDEVALFLVTQVGRDDLSDSLREQATAGLAALAAARGHVEEIANKLPGRWRDRLREIYARVSTGAGEG
jgi:hypothetical protein